MDTLGRVGGVAVLSSAIHTSCGPAVDFGE
jgi:hypothetical protein